MPFIEDSLPISASGDFSPLRSNIEDMIISCTALNKRIALMNDDMETYGLLTEETYCYDIPEALIQLQKISRSAAMCTRDINVYDDTAVVNETQLALVLYNFLSQYRNILDQLTSLQTVMKTTGNLFGVVAATLRRQDLIVNNFKQALDSKYGIVRIRSAPDWIEQKEAMRSCLQAYPMPVDTWERNY